MPSVARGLRALGTPEAPALGWGESAWAEPDGSSSDPGVGFARPVGLRNATVPPEAGGRSFRGLSRGLSSIRSSALGARNVTVPSACSDLPSGWAGSDGTRGSAGEPQETRRSCSPPKPVCRERSAPHAVAGSGRLPCWASAGEGAAAGGSSSKKCGPVSSKGAGPVAAGPAATGAERPAGGTGSDSPSEGAGRLVPGTHEAPFQYRTYPGMDGSG